VVGALIYGSILWVLGEITPQNLLGLFSADRRRAATNPATGETGRK
jgi:hypothetical protein